MNTKTITKEGEKSIVELRKIIRTPKNQEDMDKWKETVATDYLKRKAEETGNEKLKEKLERLSGKSLETVLSEKAGQEKNIIDIYLLPTSKDNYYIHYDKPKLDRKFNESLEVKIHAPCAMDSKIMKKTLKMVGSKLHEDYHQKYRKEKKEWAYAIKLFEVGSGVAGLLIGGIAAISSGIMGLPLGFLATIGLVNISTGVCYPLYRYEITKLKRLKKAGKMLKRLEIRQASWIQDTALQEIYDATYNNKPFDKRVTNHMTRNAIESLLYKKKEGQLDVDGALAHHYDSYKKIKKKETMVIKA